MTSRFRDLELPTGGWLSNEVSKDVVPPLLPPLSAAANLLSSMLLAAAAGTFPKPRLISRLLIWGLSLGEVIFGVLDC